MIQPAEATLTTGERITGYLTTNTAANGAVFVVGDGSVIDWSAIASIQTGNPAAALGARTSERKRASSAENGRKGGRPRKEAGHERR